MLKYKELKELIEYNPETGEFTSKVKRGYLRPGNRVGSWDEDNQEYTIVIKGKKYPANRLAWILTHGDITEKNMVVHHIDFDKANNRLSNLELITRSQRMKMVKRHNLDDHVVGVYPRNGGWVVQGTAVDGHKVHVGIYAEYQDAVRARYDFEVLSKYPDITNSTAYKYLEERGLI